MKNINKLNELLECAGHYHPHYGDRLATHLPMALIALSNLGASDEKLTAYFEKSIQGLEYVNESENIVEINEVGQYLGDSSKYASYLKYFKQQIAAFGFEDVVKKSLACLLPGIAASAFHALIRLAYAIEADNDNEVAVALAYWCAEFQKFELSDAKTGDTLESILAKLAPIGVNHTFSPGIIVDRMNEISRVLGEGNYRIQPENMTFSELRALCVKAFYLKNNFTLLHTVTGCHAFSVILPYLSDVDSALKAFWQSVLVAYLSTGLAFENRQPAYANHDIDFEAVIAKALQSDDSHVIKLVYSCFCEYKKRREKIYFMVANRAVGNL
ncbi:questin oxidase family protein [Thalassomonas viridans]|uniref:Questin oxidase family protein n=1 Tax=Thalassomonas viridans TaxID=137584 RepID=A0AAF0CEQ5_9GAMM|nr:questin oxidase family protein [Thalassomonas viridans]WDE08849.1 questin oxidase family protein [Thalassomonas viridans]